MTGSKATDALEGPLETWLRSLEAQQVSPHTLAAYRRDVRKLLQHQPRMVHEGLARRRERHPLTGAIQQLDAQALFQILDTYRCCRQRHVRALRAPREAVGFGDIDEELDVGKIEMRSHDVHPKIGKVLKSPDSRILLSWRSQPSIRLA